MESLRGPAIGVLAGVLVICGLEAASAPRSVPEVCASRSTSSDPAGATSCTVAPGGTTCSDEVPAGWLRRTWATTGTGCDASQQWSGSWRSLEQWYRAR